MRISDWSSDVCSSDLHLFRPTGAARAEVAWRKAPGPVGRAVSGLLGTRHAREHASRAGYARAVGTPIPRPDRKSVVEGKRGSVRVDCGGRRLIKKKNKQSDKIGDTEKE